MSTTSSRRSAKRKAASTTKSKVVANDGEESLGVPWSVLGAMIVYRESWFAEQGANIPGHLGTMSYDRQEAEGRRPSDRPRTSATPSAIRQTFTCLYMGDSADEEVEADGKTVVLNSKMPYELC